MSADPDIERAVRRTVGIATLRRLHRMIAAEQAEAAHNARIARWLGAACLIAALLTVAWMAFR